MAISVSDEREKPHVVFLPSGIGNSVLFFRLAVMMASRNCRVTFVNIQPRVVDPGFADSGVVVLYFEMLEDSSSDEADPFIGRVSAVNHGLSRLIPTLVSLRASAVFSDFAVAGTMGRISDEIGVPLFIVSTTSARFLALIAQIPLLLSRDSDIFSKSGGEIEVEGMASIQKSDIPAAWLQSSSTNRLLTSYLLPNARALSKVGGVLLNTFEFFEQETLAALDAKQPPFIPIGPLPTYEQQKGHHLPWLSDKPAQTVVYVNFGSTEVISPNQTRELRKGLETCGYHYLWVTTEAESCSGKQDRGMILREGVDQERVLADPAIGVLINQCEWQSVMQAAWEGVAVLAWPQHGDQRMNAEAVEKSGLGVWMKEWSGGGEDTVVDGDEIGRAVKQMMGDLKVKKAAKVVREKAREASGNGGSSQNAIEELMQYFHY